MIKQLILLIFSLQYNAFAEHKQPTIAEKEDEYRARRRKMIISPERNDPFADGELGVCRLNPNGYFHQQESKWSVHI